MGVGSDTCNVAYASSIDQYGSPLGSAWALASQIVNAGDTTVAIKRVSIPMTANDFATASNAGATVGVELYALEEGLPGALLAFSALVQLASLSLDSHAVPCAGPGACDELIWMTFETPQLGAVADVGLLPNLGAGYDGALYAIAVTNLNGIFDAGGAVCTYSLPAADASVALLQNTVDGVSYSSGFVKWTSSGTWDAYSNNANTVLAIELFGA